jgi:hypothetical protein
MQMQNFVADTAGNRRASLADCGHSQVNMSKLFPLPIRLARIFVSGRNTFPNLNNMGSYCDRLETTNA